MRLRGRGAVNCVFRVRVRVRSAENFYFTCAVAVSGCILNKNYGAVISCVCAFYILFMIIEALLLIGI